MSKSKSKMCENFTLRLDPKLKYLSEITGRSQRRSLTNFIECALVNYLELNQITNKNKETLSAMDSDLWDIDKDVRLEKLAKNFPDLLTYDEQICIKNINKTGEHNE